MTIFLDLLGMFQHWLYFLVTCLKPEKHYCSWKSVATRATILKKCGGLSDSLNNTPLVH